MAEEKVLIKTDRRSGRVYFNPTINLGTILQLIAILASVYAFTYRLAAIESKVDLMWNGFQIAFPNVRVPAK